MLFKLSVDQIASAWISEIHKVHKVHVFVVIIKVIKYFVATSTLVKFSVETSLRFVPGIIRLLFHYQLCFFKRKQRRCFDNQIQTVRTRCVQCVL
jgi:hypothetical protein